MLLKICDGITLFTTEMTYEFPGDNALPRTILRILRVSLAVRDPAEHVVWVSPLLLKNGLQIMGKVSGCELGIFLSSCRLAMFSFM